MKNNSPFSESRGIGVATSYSKIGGHNKPPNKNKKPRDIETLRYGDVTHNQEEIDLCLTCPYPRCVERCKRLRNYRKQEEERQSGK